MLFRRSSTRCDTTSISTEWHHRSIDLTNKLLRADSGGKPLSGSGRRQLQNQGDKILVTVETHAPSMVAASQATSALLLRLPGAQQHRRHLQQASGDHDVCGLGSNERGCTPAGEFRQSTDILISQADIEAIARTHDPAMSPTLDEMLIGGSAENQLLASIFVDEQQPLIIHPTTFASATASSGRRHLQTSGDVLHATVETRAATASEALIGVERLATRLQGTLVGSDRPRTCDLPSHTQLVADECCNDKSEHCNDGVPISSCNAACAGILLPFVSECSNDLGPLASKFSQAAHLCQSALGTGSGSGYGAG